MTAKPSSDPHSPEYGNDDPTWEARDDFHQHVLKAEQMVEEILEGGKYCSICRASTNHRASDHDEEPTDE